MLLLIKSGLIFFNLCSNPSLATDIVLYVIWHMGDVIVIVVIAQVSHNEWKINMVGTIRRSNQMGDDIKPTCDGMTKHTYKTAIWQHNNLPLCIAA